MRTTSAAGAARHRSPAASETHWAVSLGCALGVLAVVTGVTLAPAPAAAAPAQAYDGHLEQANAWAVEQLNAPAAWESTRGEGVTVAVVDTGMGAHPFFEDKDVLPGYSTALAGGEDAWYDVAPDRDEPDHARGHGTGVTAMALLAAPEATILPVRHSMGDERLARGGHREDSFEAIRWAVDNGADVVAVAWGACCTEADADAVMAVRHAIDNDVVVVAGSGNDPERAVEHHSPASIPGVVAVSGTAQDGGRWQKSSVGPEVVVAGPADYSLSWPVPQEGHGAEGTRVPGARGPGRLYHESGGTSAATGWVAGVVGLIRAAHPDLDASNAIQRLIQTADDRGAEGRDDVFGYGVPDAGAAVRADVPRVDRNPLGYPFVGPGARGATASREAVSGTGAAAGGPGTGSGVVPLLAISLAATVLGGRARLLTAAFAAGQPAGLRGMATWSTWMPRRSGQAGPGSVRERAGCGVAVEPVVVCVLPTSLSTGRREYKRVLVLESAGTWTRSAMSANPAPDLDEALRALADANRRAILAVVRSGPRSVGQIADEVGLSQQTASHHLGVLRAAGLASRTKVGTRHLFAVNTDGLAAVRAYLDGFWPTRLAALKAAVESSDDSSDG